MMKTSFISTVLKGFAVGSANVIPGVSGGTIALITGIFERLINAIKAFDTEAVRLLLKLRLRAFAEHTDLAFLSSLFLGVFLAVVTLARLFEYLFAEHPVYIWSFFFGLILASIYYVGITVGRWRAAEYLSLAAGLAAALVIAFMKPAGENASFFYLVLSGVAGICSMILPGLSGSFVLIIMGNYQLIVIEAVNNLRLDILFPVALGAAAGLALFARVLSWLLGRFHSQTLAVLTGFISGSLAILWPWKEALHLLDESGQILLKDGDKIVSGYQWLLPDLAKSENLWAFAIILLGIGSIILLERLGGARAADEGD